MAKKAGSGTAAVFKMIKANDAKMVDLKFIDLLGVWQHVTIPIHRLEAQSRWSGISETKIKAPI